MVGSIERANKRLRTVPNWEEANAAVCCLVCHVVVPRRRLVQVVDNSVVGAEIRSGVVEMVPVGYLVGGRLRSITSSVHLCSCKTWRRFLRGIAEERVRDVTVVGRHVPRVREVEGSHVRLGHRAFHLGRLQCSKSRTRPGGTDTDSIRLTSSCAVPVRVEQFRREEQLPVHRTHESADISTSEVTGCVRPVENDVVLVYPSSDTADGRPSVYLTGRVDVL